MLGMFDQVGVPVFYIFSLVDVPKMRLEASGITPSTTVPNRL
jgi:hypothetical protein|tara:strand:- start:878 stop:1003 length:126 start_codon:yes stop_codon:yes gene_type:complete